MHPPPSPARANFTLMTECTPESSSCYSVYSVVSTTRVTCGSKLSMFLFFLKYKAVSRFCTYWKLNVLFRKPPLIRWSRNLPLCIYVWRMATWRSRFIRCDSKSKKQAVPRFCLKPKSCSILNDKVAKQRRYSGQDRYCIIKKRTAVFLPVIPSRLF